MAKEFKTLSLGARQKDLIYKKTEKFSLPFTIGSGFSGEEKSDLIPDIQAVMTEVISDVCPEVAESLENVNNGKEQIILLKDFPTGFTPKTPHLDSSEGYNWQPKGILPTFIMMGLAGKMGIGLDSFTMFAVPPYRVQNGIAKPEVVHTDSCFYNMLFCLRGNEEAVTGYMTFDDIFSEMPEDLKAELFRKNFKVRNKGEELFPVFYEDQKRGRIMPYFAASIQNSIATTDIGREALQFISAQRNSEKAARVLLQTGDILIFDNTAGVHWRDAFRTNQKMFADTYGGSPDMTFGEKMYFSETDRFVLTMFLPNAKKPPVQYREGMEIELSERISSLKAKEQKGYFVG